MSDLLKDGQAERAEDGAERPLRRDAERNRRLIMDAARELFADRGLDITLDEIAKHAGVGVGTAYRRFANKDALIDELFEDRIAEMAAVAEEALDNDDPWLGLCHFMEEALALQAADRGLKQVLLSSGVGRERVCSARDRITPLTDKIAERAKEAGVVRPDFTEADMPMIATMVGSVMDATREVDPDAWRRYLSVALAGIAADPRAAGELTQPALSREQVDDAIHRSSTGRR